MTNKIKQSLETNFGYITIAGENGCITSIKFTTNDESTPKTASYIENCKVQIIEYLHSTRQRFNCRFKVSGDSLQKKVWYELLKIPYGVTVSDKDFASEIGLSDNHSFVTNAIKENPLAILIPCHRVKFEDNTNKENSNNKDVKQYLLDIEKVQ